MNKLNLRIINTHDTEEKWRVSGEFIPKAGEVIVYDVDENYTYERFKIGDGVTPIKDLPFTIDKVVEQIFNVTDNVVYLDGGRIKQITQ